MVSLARVGQAWLVLGIGAALLGCGATKSGEPDAGGGEGPGSNPDVLVGPPSQGAGVFSLRAQSPAVQGKMCPVAALTSGIPAAEGPDMLDADTYVKHVVDGDGLATVTCKVSGSSSFTFEGSLRLGGRGLRIGNGVLGADKAGTADITVTDSQSFSGSLASPAPCTIDATVAPGQNFQVKAGSMWAAFDCPSVEQAPSDSCAASGVFVIENCER